MNHQNDIARLIKQGRLDSAEQLCHGQLSTRPTDAQAWFYLGAIQSMDGRRREAIRSLQVAITHGGEEEKLVLRTAQALLRLRAYRQAYPLFLRLDFANPQVILGLARCRWGVGEYEAALVNLSGLWQARPEWAELALTYTRALSSMDQTGMAEAVLKRIIHTHPHEAEVQHQYALWLISNESDEAAWHWLKQQRIERDSAKLATLRQALKRLHENPATGMPTIAGERQASQWESFTALLDEAGAVRWFGDNTALLKQAAQQLPDEGVVVECGVFHGRSLRLLSTWIDRECHGFDSFQGLPEAWSAQESAGAYSTNNQMPTVDDNTMLHQGWFDETLPHFADELNRPIALLHIDCDLYSSTKTVLEYLVPKMSSGGIIVFDDYLGYPGWREHEYKALHEYLETNPQKLEIESAVLLGRSVSMRITMNG